MADPTDFASDREEKERERAIAVARARSSIVAPPSNECANECGEKPAEKSRFCCKECAEDFETRRRRLRNQGVR
jgi:transposase-like protein